MSRNKYFTLCLIGLLAAQASFAEPVSREKARTVASNFARSINVIIATDDAKGLADAPTSTQFHNFYVFTGSNGKGFVIVSADDCVPPILGYSDKDSFNFDDMPDHVAAWLQGYEEQIEHYRNDASLTGSSVAMEWEALYTNTASQKKGWAKTGTTSAVPPLIQTEWNQDPLYNAYCPRHVAYRYCPLSEHDTDTLRGYSLTVTGCVATATAQVMKYWNWPPHGRGSYSYTYDYTPLLYFDSIIDDTIIVYRRNLDDTLSNTLSASFQDTVFAWENMPIALDPLSSQTEVNAVASLMHTVGIALDMDYGTINSGAITISGNTLGNHVVEEVLRDYFYYSYTTNSVLQQDFTQEEWKALLRNELDAARPIVYKGRSTSGSGHSFICDGYDDNDLFHFNWGWGGSCNGYYAIGALNPSEGGTGAAEESNYNLECGAVIGIEPAATMAPEEGTTTVMAIANNAAYGTVTGSGTYTNWQDVVTLRAIPNDGYTFVQWSDGCRYNPRRLIASGGNQTYTATFESFSSGNVSYCGTFPNTISYYDATATIPEWGILIPFSMLGNGYVIDNISFIGLNGSYTIKAYRRGRTPSEGELVYTSNTYTITGAQVIHAATNILVSSGDSIWVTLTSSDGGRCASRIASNQINGSWAKESGIWTHPNNTVYPYLIMCHVVPPAYNPVIDLRATAVTSTGATIAWTAPTTDEPSSYTLAYGTGYQPELLPSTTTNATTATLTGLLNNTEYHVFVRANYNDHYSGWANIAFTTTDVTNPIHITGSANNPAMGFVAGCGIYEQGSSVTLEAIPMLGYTFVGWADNQSTNPLRTVIATTDAEYIANFESEGYTFTANSDNEALGSVTVEGTVCYTIGNENYYPFLSTVALNALPNEGASFSHWSDGNTTNPRYCTVMESNPTYTAHFVASSKGITYSNEGRQLTISTAVIEPIRIYDMLGRTVYANDQADCSPKVVTLPAAGMYIIRIGSEYSEKLIIR